MTNVKDKLATDSPEALDEIEEAAEESRKAKEAAARKKRRAGTKYGSMLEDEDN